MEFLLEESVEGGYRTWRLEERLWIVDDDCLLAVRLDLYTL